MTYQDVLSSSIDDGASSGGTRILGRAHVEAALRAAILLAATSESGAEELALIGQERMHENVPGEKEGEKSLKLHGVQS